MLIKELIDLPEKVFRGDFVLNLSAGVADPKKTVEQYVVTDDLAKRFDDALLFVKGSIDGRLSRATYLHGSFGSGKSHFMAILHLLLHGDVHARSIPKLAPVVTKHNAWTVGKKFLLVPYHLIGATNMESAILGGYVDHVARCHPNAPVPAVFKSELIFENADQLRRQMGDDKFFAALNSKPKEGGWGELEGAWDAASYAEALKAPRSPKKGESDACVRLMQDLIGTLLSSYAGVVSHEGSAYVSLDDGLSIMSRHASQLGYDAVILFLDELVLWLASRAADVAFIHAEGQKLSKLVEAQQSDRPIPVVSFVARQRDLRELVGEHITGVEQLRFSDALKHWEGRFGTIKLEDRNLPAIAAERVLRPKSEAARQQIDAAFKETEKYRQEVTDTLLTSHGNREMFRQVYPFSPALIDTLVAVSAMLQRERTALKVMLELLVEQREHLQLGDIVPAGDLWDLVATGDEAFIDEMRKAFESARRLYHEQLLPLIEADHNLTAEQEKQRPWDDQKARLFRADDRLIKTLLLAALVPQVESFRNLTSNKLAALNHGTIRASLPGGENRMVLAKVRSWASRCGNIRVSDDEKPVVSVVLSGVDVESILEAVKGEDNPGNQRQKVKQLLCEQFGLEQDEIDRIDVTREFFWRGTKRSVHLVFANVRELNDVSLKCDGPTWKLVIDYPFDAQGRGPGDDIARLEKFRDEGAGSQFTLVWLPSFLSVDAKKDLGRLVRLDHVLAGERFNGLAAHLSQADRATAKSLLQNQQSQLRQQMIKCLDAAYGIDRQPLPGQLDTSHDTQDHFHSLDEGLVVQPPVGANLRQALEHLAGQALGHQFPGHPLFDEEVKASTIKNKVWPEVQRAIRSPEPRILVDQPNRVPLRQIAGPLRLGEMHETHFVLADFWRQHFLKQHAASGGGDWTVEKLSAWIDVPKPMGLQKELRNLLILAFAEQGNFSFFRHGGPHTPTIDDLPKELVLRLVDLPSDGVWVKAAERASLIFGLTPSKLKNSANFTKLGEDLRKSAGDHREVIAKLAAALQRIHDSQQVDRAASDRLRTVISANELMTKLASSTKPVEDFAAAVVATSDAAAGASIRRADSVLRSLEQVQWSLFEGLADIEEEVRLTLSTDEHVKPLGQAMEELQRRAIERLKKRRPEPPQPLPQPLPPPPPPPPAEHWEEVEIDKPDALDELLEQLRPKIGQGQRLLVRWTQQPRE